MRARNLKPSFFTDDQLVELPPLVRLLFQGLWCLSDCRGVLEDRPKQIKMRVLPADDLDVDGSLALLSACRTSDGSPMVFRYRDASGRALLYLVNFRRHQKPHPKERPAAGEMPTAAQLEAGGFAPTRITEIVGLNQGPAVEFRGQPGKFAASPALPSSPSLPSESPFLPPSEEEEGAARLQPAPPPAAPVMAMPVREGEEPITGAEIDEWQALYGNIDVRETLNHMRGHWLAAPVSNRKTRRGIRTSIVRWLAKDHDRARASPARPATTGVEARNAELRALKAALRDGYRDEPDATHWRAWVDEVAKDRNVRAQLLCLLREIENGETEDDHGGRKCGKPGTGAGGPAGRGDRVDPPPSARAG